MTQTFRAVALLVAGAAAVGTVACSRASNSQAVVPDGAREQAAIAVTVQPVVVADLADAVDVIGSLAPKFAADVKSEVSGTVRAVYVTQWVPVRKGTRLASLDTSEIQAGLEGLKALEAQARVAAARARREHDRALQLKQYGLITTQGLEEATSAVEAAEAAVEAASAQVRAGEARLAKSSINAPMDGVVAERNVSVGDRVENMGGNLSMFRIVDNSLLDLTVTVPSIHLSGLRVGQALEFTTDAVPGRTFTGKVMFINPSVDQASRSAKVIAEVPNRDGALRGGLFVKGRIVRGVRKGVLQIPREALLGWDLTRQTATVFVVRSGRAEERRVTTGTTSATLVEITSGVSQGDPIVTRGGFALKRGDRVTTAREGA